MPDDKKKQRKPKRRQAKRPPRHNAVNVTIWSMNGEPVPAEVLDKIELSVTMEALASPVRLLHSVTRT